ncbi:methionine ABC transporter ATP-binding protein [Rubeoparvulum massiliense]|uniref:methionine ABC transporter ATP-binding protein n=1 Tax=Rubeoparvulum massiliense TaxID=1631346 RepID=UPI00065E2F67|nr:methionine ABC transporter ATP-binding protein [Rubeoparvulum massiliense]
MIQFQNVTKVYERNGRPVAALNGINLSIKQGEIFGVIGFSGAGKSSLLRCVNLLETPTSGRVLVQGRDITTLSPRDLRLLKRQIGIVFQHFNLLDSKTVFTNVAMPLILAGEKPLTIKERVKELLQFVGLGDKGDFYPDQLSGGQKQRVGIARALATQPSILLCDEATSALDPQTTQSILQLLLRIHREYNMTILLITHEMSVIRDVCQRVAVIEGGKVIETGTVFELFSHPKTRTAKNFVSSVIHDTIPSTILNLITKGGGQRSIYQIQFVGEATAQPILSQVAKRFPIDVNILHGHITELQGIPFGNLIVELQGHPGDVNQALLFINQTNVQIKEVSSDAS